MPGSITATPVYPDVRAAIDFLTRAFGFEVHALHEDDDGSIGHVELTHGATALMLAEAGPDGYGSLLAEVADDHRPTCGFYVVVDDPDAHHDRAEAAGAELLGPIQDRDYGSREYTCRDLAGHVWTFGTYDPFAAD